MNVKNHIGKTIGTSWLSLIVVSGAQLIMIPVALAHLEKTDFALFAIITQVFTSILLAEMGVRSACARLLIDAAAKGEEKYNKVWMASCVVFVFQACIMLTLTLAIAPLLGRLFDLNSAQRDLVFWIFIVVGIKNAVGYLLSVFGTALLSGQFLHRLNGISIISTSIMLISFCVLMNLGFKLWSYPISAIVSFCVSQPLIIREAFKNNVVGKFSIRLIEWVEVKEILILGMDVFVAALFSVAMGHSLLLFSGYLLTLEETAILAVNLKLVSLMTQILQRVPGSTSPTLMKMVSHGDYGSYREWWGYTAKMTICLSLFGAGMYVFSSGFIIKLWTSKPEMEMSGVSLLLLSLIPFRYLVHYMFVNSLAIFKEIRKVKLWLVWEIILYVILAILLGSSYGMVGLLSANIISMLGGALFIGMKYLAIYSKASFSSLFKFFLKLVVPLGLSLLVLFYFFQQLQYSDLLNMVMMSSLWVMVFAVIGYSFILSLDEKTKIKRLLKITH